MTLIVRYCEKTIVIIIIVIAMTINLLFHTLSNIGLHSDQFHVNFQAQMMMVMLTITRELLRLRSKRVVKNYCGSTSKTTECFEI